jgi:drug/metabolite transporter (DMT)-like permease
MDLWILATFSAAFFQTLRFMLQKVLASGTLSPTGSTFARFAYAMPAGWLVLILYLLHTDAAIPPTGSGLWIWGAIGGLGQILATVCVVMIFKSRSFAVGITLKKTEVLQTALIGSLFFAEAINPIGWLAIGIGMAGVLLLTEGSGLGVFQQLGSRAVVLGLASGFFFAIAGVGYRAATLAVDSGDPLLRAGIGMAVVSLMQTIALAIWLRWKEPGQVTAVWQARRVAVWLGLTSMAGTMSWFTAFTLQVAAYVYAVGQVELIFSLMASVLFFREVVSRREIFGILLLTASILVLIFGGSI